MDMSKSGCATEEKRTGNEERQRGENLQHEEFMIFCL
jgi:hypothetical protein